MVSELVGKEINAYLAEGLSFGLLSESHNSVKVNETVKFGGEDKMAYNKIIKGYRSKSI
jgi:hypothetical protein